MSDGVDLDADTDERISNAVIEVGETPPAALQNDERTVVARRGRPKARRLAADLLKSAPEGRIGAGTDVVPAHHRAVATAA